MHNIEFWQGFASRNNDDFSANGGNQSFISEEWDGQSGVKIVATRDIDKPCVIFVGGIMTLTAMRASPNQAFKMFSSLSHYHIKPEDINLYIVTNRQGNDDPKILDLKKKEYKIDPKNTVLHSGEQLLDFIFPLRIIPDLKEEKNEESRKLAVKNLQYIASNVTFFGFSFGPIILECMYNQLRQSFRQKGFHDSEINEITNCFISHHFATVHPLTDKEPGMPQVNSIALNDVISRPAGNDQHLDKEQHAKLLHTIIGQNTLLIAATDISGDYSYLSLLRQDRELPNLPTSSSVTFVDGSTQPSANNYLKFKTHPYPQRHGFGLYTSLTRLVTEEDGNPITFAIHTFSLNPTNDICMQALADSVKESIRCKKEGMLRDGLGLVEKTARELTTEKKNLATIQCIRDAIWTRYTGVWTERYNAFADRLIPQEEFKPWAAEEYRVEQRLLKEFDERATKVLSGEETLDSFIRWSKRHTEKSGKLRTIDPNRDPQR